MSFFSLQIITMIQILITLKMIIFAVVFQYGIKNNFFAHKRQHHFAIKFTYTLSYKKS